MKSIEELLRLLPKAETNTQKQRLASLLIAELPDYLKELGELEQQWYKTFRTCIHEEVTKAAAEIMLSETDIHKEYKYKKRLHESTKSALSVLGMYTGEKK